MDMRDCGPYLFFLLKLASAMLFEDRDVNSTKDLAEKQLLSLFSVFILPTICLEINIQNTKFLIIGFFFEIYIFIFRPPPQNTGVCFT